MYQIINYEKLIVDNIYRQILLIDNIYRYYLYEKYN